MKLARQKRLAGEDVDFAAAASGEGHEAKTKSKIEAEGVAVVADGVASEAEATQEHVIEELADVEEEGERPTDLVLIYGTRWASAITHRYCSFSFFVLAHSRKSYCHIVVGKV